MIFKSLIRDLWIYWVLCAMWPAFALCERHSAGDRDSELSYILKLKKADEHPIKKIHNQLKKCGAIKITDSFSFTQKCLNSCQSEQFRHKYLVEDNSTEWVTNEWKTVRFGEAASLKKLCLQSNGMPVTRRCLFNATENMAYWEPLGNETVVCMNHTREHIITDRLNSLHEHLLDGSVDCAEVNECRNFLHSFQGILDEPDYQLLPADLFITNGIFKAISDKNSDPMMATGIVGICDKFMSSDPKVLRRSNELNSTNALLDLSETFLDGLVEKMVPRSSCSPLHSINSTLSIGNKTQEVDYAHIGVRAQISAQISVFYINPLCANITGIALYSMDAKGRGADHYLTADIGNFKYRFVHMNESIESITLEEGLQVASFLPLALWDHLNEVFSETKDKQILLVLKIYAHDGLFIESTERRLLTRKPFSKVISISIPGFQGSFPSTLAVPFILRKRTPAVQSTTATVISEGTGCAYWDYSTWVSSGVTMLSSNAMSANDSLILCTSTHLTQFSFLMGGTYRVGDLSDDILITTEHEKALDIITIVGCSLSMAGLLGIWVTVAVFPKWWKLASTKILLNMCMALTLQMVLFVFVNTDEMSETLIRTHSIHKCVFLGALMQYSTLVLFTWMLIIACLQFQRYVTVIGISRPKHYILKAAVLAWTLPLLPTLLVACIDPNSYLPNEYQLRMDIGVCYPSGLGLVLGVVMPVTLIVFANLGIFIYIFYSITNSLSQSMQRNEKRMIMKQLRLSVLLFFLLGLSWIFGVFTFMQAGIVFSYLFCLTATLQGFALFIFFVVLDDVVSQYWRELICCKSRKSLEATKHQEMVSITTSTNADK